MKRVCALLLCLLCLAATAALAETASTAEPPDWSQWDFGDEEQLPTGTPTAEPLGLPLATPAPLTGDWTGYLSGGGAVVTNAAVPIRFDILTKDGENILLVARQRGGVWETETIARTAVRRGDPPSVSPADKNSLSLCYYGADGSVERYDFRADATGAFAFCGYVCDRADGSGLRVDFEQDNRLRYSETTADGGLRAAVLSASLFALTLEAFDADALPVTLDEAAALGAPDAMAVAEALVRPDAALGENIGQAPDRPLYDQPNGKPVAWVFAGAEATALEPADAGWTRVRVGALTGYIADDALAFGAARREVTRRPPSGMVWELSETDHASLYAQPRTDAQVVSVHSTEVSDLVRVLAALPDGWLMVESGAGKTGFMEAVCVNQCEDGYEELPRTRRALTVLNPDPADRLNLREGPDQGAASLGRYYSGVRALALFEARPTAGWRFVRIGDLCGYMMADYLREQTAFSDVVQIISDVGYLPPAATLRKGAVLRAYSSGRSATGAALSGGERVTVLGTMGDEWYYVRARADILGWRGLLGWLPKDELTRVGPAVSSRIAVRRDTPAYAVHDDASEVLAQLRAGDEVRLLCRTNDAWACVLLGEGAEPVCAFVPTDCLAPCGD